MDWKKPSRFLLTASVALGLVLSLGCEKNSPFVDHALNRLGYGPDPWTQARLIELGPFQYIEEQLDPDSIDDRPVETVLTSYPSLQMGLSDLWLNYGDSNGLLGRPIDARIQLRSAKIVRAIASRRQLLEVLTDFWFNHFNVDAAGNAMALKTIHYEASAIRPHVLGKFEDLLLATARHPAMLDYLDNQSNFRDGFQAMGRTWGLNENYAREILELHTLGVGGGYSQDDVISVAKAFTGWTTTYAIQRSWIGDGFQFLPEGHDESAKLILNGQLVLSPNGGEDDGRQVILFLARHPKTAERLSRKLVARFLDEESAAAVREELVRELSQIWLSTQGDLHAVTQRLLEEVVLSLGQQRQKVKRPLHFAASIIRAGRGDVTTEPGRLAGALSWMGEDLYMTGPPTGLPDRSGHWASSGGLLYRFNGADVLISSSEAFGLEFDVEQGTAEVLVDGAISQFTPSGIHPEVRRVIVDSLDAMPGATDREKAERARTLVLSTPEFLSH
ncbi:MAG: hypothetical protein CBC48_19725 [bacterium TMED88]|nr:hypothetical protein [Deltaproteobacteria bacterium]OUV22030.1 MAG: hypothetical protein CBC48_19725 [bacterium TMED88]